MDKFYAKTTEEYFQESERREKIYKDLCKISGDLCDKWMIDPSYHDAFFEVFLKLDPAYLDWKNGVCFDKIIEEIQ